MIKMKKSEDLKQEARRIAHYRAKRSHCGQNHWHVNKRSSVIICKKCNTKIPIWKNPQYCPVCFEGKS